MTGAGKYLRWRVKILIVVTWQRVAKCAAQLVEAEGDDENKIIVFPSDNTSALSSASAHQSRQLSAQRKNIFWQIFVALWECLDRCDGVKKHSSMITFKLLNGVCQGDEKESQRCTHDTFIIPSWNFKAIVIVRDKNEEKINFSTSGLKTNASYAALYS